MNKCDVCGHEGEDVKAGRWIFYCPKHKDVDWSKTYNNEVKGQDTIDISDGQLCDMILENL